MDPNLKMYFLLKMGIVTSLGPPSTLVQCQVTYLHLHLPLALQHWGFPKGIQYPQKKLTWHWKIHHEWVDVFPIWTMGDFRQYHVRFLGGFSLPFQAMSCGVARRRSTLELSGENSQKKRGNNKHGWGRKNTTFEAKWRFLQWFLSTLPPSLTWNLEDSGWKMIWPLFRGHSVVFGGGFIVVLKGNIGNWKNVKTDGPPSAHWRYKQRSSPTDCWLDEDVGSDHSKWGISLPKVRFCASQISNELSKTFF